MFALKMTGIVFLSGLIAQIIKIVSFYIEHRKINFSRFFETGGMPSSHASTATALTILVGIYNGFNNVLFIITLFFAMVIMYDAAGIRRAAGRQAAILNRIVEEMVRDKHINEERLVELLGHTPLEVFMGSILGILVAVIFA